MSTESEMARLGRVMHAQGLIAATDGNISVRVGQKILTTPSGAHLGFLKPDDLVECALDGRVLKGRGRPTSELAMHLTAYAQRPDVGAVIHAHPPFVTALSLAGMDLNAALLPEVIVTLGAIPTAPYAPPTSRQGAENAAPLLVRHDAIVLERNGSLCLGRDLMSAFGNLERMEFLARVTVAAQALGPPRPLGQAEQKDLLALGRSLGFLKDD